MCVLQSMSKTKESSANATNLTVSAAICAKHGSNRDSAYNLQSKNSSC